MMIGADPFGLVSKPSLLENRHRQSFLAQAHYRIYGLMPIFTARMPISTSITIAGRPPLFLASTLSGCLLFTLLVDFFDCSDIAVPCSALACAHSDDCDQRF